MKYLAFLLAALLVLSGCLSGERPANEPVNNSGTSQTTAEVINNQVEESSQNISSGTTIATDDRTPMQRSVDKLNEEILKTRLNKTAESNATETTASTGNDVIEKIISTTVPISNRTQFGGAYDHIEVIHFHGNAQCDSCRAVGAYAEETINAYLAEDLKSGKILFGHVNYDLAENRPLAQKYGVSGSSLWIGTFKGADSIPKKMWMSGTRSGTKPIT